MEQPKKRRRTTTSRADETTPSALSSPQPPPDLISALPLDLLRSIFFRLPLRDAARTTAVSKSPWRMLFGSLPHLVFDKSVLGLGSSSSDEEDDDDYEEDEGRGHGVRLPDVIYSVLESRDFRSVLTCEIDCGFYEDEEWILDTVVQRLCENGSLQELVLKNSDIHDTSFIVPQDILDCRSLVKLELEHCTFDVTEVFDGLRCLKSLVLRKVELCDSELQTILSCCSALESIVLSDCYVLEYVNVSSQSLLSLEISSSSLFGLSVKHADVLRDVAVSFLYNEALFEDDDNSEDYENTMFFENRKFLQFCTDLSHVETLRLQFGDEFSDVFEEMPEMLPEGFLFSNLKKLVMVFDFLDTGFQNLLSRLLSWSPNLEELDIEITGSCNIDGRSSFFSNFWSRKNPSVCVKHHLRLAHFDQVNYPLEGIVGLVRFLLINAEVLEKLTIKHSDRQDKATIFELALLIEPWASSNAVLEFKHAEANP